MAARSVRAPKQCSQIPKSCSSTFAQAVMQVPIHMRNSSVGVMARSQSEDQFTDVWLGRASRLDRRPPQDLLFAEDHALRSDSRNGQKIAHSDHSLSL